MLEKLKSQIAVQKNINYDAAVNTPQVAGILSKLRPAVKNGQPQPQDGLKPEMKAPVGQGVNLANGALVSIFGSKGIAPAMIMQTIDYSTANSIVQFTIDNTGAGNAAQKLRIGGVVAEKGDFSKHNIAAGASDNAVIVDEYGAGCLKVQGFSELVCYNGVIVKTIKISTASLTQKDQTFTHNTLHYDDTIVPMKNNVGFTAEKSDQLTTLSVAHGNWILGSAQYFEFPILAAVSLTIFLELSGTGNVKGFTQIGN